MKNKNALKITVVLAIVAVVMLALCICVSADETTSPDLNIEYCNLAFQSDTHILYAIKSNDANVKLLVWSEPQAEYLLGTQSTVVNPYSEQMTIEGEPYTVFKYAGLTAKQMTDNVYVRACIDNGSEVTYGEVHKYSILQYAYNKLGKTDIATTNESLINMLNEMLSFGASAQQYHGYKTDTLATDEFVQVNLADGALPDGFRHGLYKIGTTVRITTPQTNSENGEFIQWVDKDKNIVSDSPSYDLTVGDNNNTYTAEYAISVSYYQGVIFFSNRDGTCYVGGYTVDLPEIVNIPPISPAGDKVTSIQHLAFSGCDWITSITIPEGVASIGESAFAGCTNLLNVTLPSTLTNISDNVFYYCTGLTSIIIPEGVTNIGYHTFYGCSKNLTVYCEADIQPSGWNSNWNPENCTVYWGQVIRA